MPNTQDTTGNQTEEIPRSPVDELKRRATQINSQETVEIFFADLRNHMVSELGKRALDLKVESDYLLEMAEKIVSAYSLRKEQEFSKKVDQLLDRVEALKNELGITDKESLAPQTPKLSFWQRLRGQKLEEENRETREQLKVSEVQPSEIFELIGEEKLKTVMLGFIDKDEKEVRENLQNIFNDVVADNDQKKRIFSRVQKFNFTSIPDFITWWKKDEVHGRVFEAIQLYLTQSLERKVCEKGGKGLEELEAKAGRTGGKVWNWLRTAFRAAAPAGIVGAAVTIGLGTGALPVAAAAVVSIMVSRIFRRGNLAVEQTQKLTGEHAKELEEKRKNITTSALEEEKRELDLKGAESLAAYLAEGLNESLIVRQKGTGESEAQKINAEALGEVAKRAKLRAEEAEKRSKAEAEKAKAAAEAKSKASSGQAHGSGATTTAASAPATQTETTAATPESHEAKLKLLDYVVASLDYRNQQLRDNVLLSKKTAVVGERVGIFRELGSELASGNITGLWMHDKSAAKRWLGSLVEGVAGGAAALTIGGLSGLGIGARTLGRFLSGAARGGTEGFFKAGALERDKRKVEIENKAKDLVGVVRSKLTEWKGDTNKTFDHVKTEYDELNSYWQYAKDHPAEKLFARNPMLATQIEQALSEVRREIFVRMTENVERKNQEKLGEVEAALKHKDKGAGWRRAWVAIKTGVKGGAIVASIGAAFDLARGGLQSLHEKLWGEKIFVKVPTAMVNREMEIEEHLDRRGAEQSLPQIKLESPPPFDFKTLDSVKNLSEEELNHLHELVSTYPALNNPESINNIIEAVQRSNQRQVHLQITEHKDLVQFEEIVKHLNGDSGQAITYLEKQGFNSFDHRAMRIKGPADYTRFVEKYREFLANPLVNAKELNQMRSGLGKAFQHDEMRDDYSWRGKKGVGFYEDDKGVFLGKNVRDWGVTDETGDRELLTGNAEEKVYTKAKPTVAIQEAIQSQPAQESHLPVGAKPLTPEELALFQQQKGGYADQVNEAIRRHGAEAIHLDTMTVVGSVPKSPIIHAEPVEGGVRLDYEDGKSQIVEPFYDQKGSLRFAVVDAHIAASEKAQSQLEPGVGGVRSGIKPSEPPMPERAAEAEIRRIKGTETDMPEEMTRQDTLEGARRLLQDQLWNEREKVIGKNYIQVLEWQERALGHKGTGIARIARDDIHTDMKNEHAETWVEETTKDMVERQNLSLSAARGNLIAKKNFSAFKKDLENAGMVGFDQVPEDREVIDTELNYRSYKKWFVNELKDQYRPIKKQIDKDWIQQQSIR